MMSLAYSDSARSTPLASVIVPRIAGICSLEICWLTAAAWSVPAFSTPRSTARSTAIVSRTRKPTKM